MKNIKGITLIEVIVLIMVFAFIITLLLPAFTTAANRESSFLAVCSNRLKNFGIANNIYANEFNGSCCPVEFLEPNANGTVHKGGVSYSQILWPANNAFRSYLNCDSYPKDKKNAPLPGASGWASYNGPYNMPLAFLCPADIISNDWNNNLSGVLMSYAYNTTDFQISWSSGGPFIYGYKISEVKRPSKLVLFIDGIDWWCGGNVQTNPPAGANYARGWDTHGQMNISEYRGSGAGRGLPAVYGPVLYRHNEGAVGVFYDGHAEYMKKQDWYNPNNQQSTLYRWSNQ